MEIFSVCPGSIDSARLAFGFGRPHTFFPGEVSSSLNLSPGEEIDNARWTVRERARTVSK
jgi:hypothetical protein